MKYKTLGSTGLLVSELCLGTMTFGGRGFWTAIGDLDQSVADAIMSQALDTVSALPAEYPGWMIARQSSDRIPR